MTAFYEAELTSGSSSSFPSNYDFINVVNFSLAAPELLLHREGDVCHDLRQGRRKFSTLVEGEKLQISHVA